MEKDLQPLGDSEIRRCLQGEDMHGWIFVNNKISKEFEFSSFDKAIELINELTPFCNRIDHHPNIHIYFKRVVFELQRFSSGERVTERDFTVAREIERLFLYL